MRPSSEIRKQLEEKTGVLIGNSTVHRMLPLMGISRKKTLHADEKEPERVQLLRLDFWLKIQVVLTENLIFLDESGRSVGGGSNPTAEPPL